MSAPKLCGRDERKFRVLLAMAKGRPCLMCGEEPANGAGAFLPTDSEAYGAASGTQRIVVYPCCPACWDATTPERREARFECWGRAA